MGIPLKEVTGVQRTTYISEIHQNSFIRLAKKMKIPSAGPLLSTITFYQYYVT